MPLIKATIFCKKTSLYTNAYEPPNNRQVTARQPPTHLSERMCATPKTIKTIKHELTTAQSNNTKLERIYTNPQPYGQGLVLADNKQILGFSAEYIHASVAVLAGVS